MLIPPNERELLTNLAFAIDPASIVFVTVVVSPVVITVPVEEGRVTVTSAVEAGPINVSLFVPLSESS